MLNKIRNYPFGKIDEIDDLDQPTDFDCVVERAMVSRRDFLGGLVVMGSGAVAMGAGLLPTGAVQAETIGASRFAFKPVPIATDATVHVPEGYTWQAFAKWGEPLFSNTADLDHATGGTAASSARAVGENTDGMELFSIGSRQVLCVNHEYANLKVNLPNNPDGMPTSAEEVLKIQNVQGVMVAEIAEDDKGWHIVKDSPYNRRITHNTEMRMAGPAAGHDLLKTAIDPSGTVALGTLNNCGAGKTPWGTYLTCEENFHGYFGSTDEAIEVTPRMKRYGLNAKGRYDYENFDPRFDMSKNPNEPHKHGWIVEIDPSNAQSTPVKHTALGRIKHENAAVTLAGDGRVVVYMGDDERGEFLYKYVSNGVYTPGGKTSELLDDGKLYAARFKDDGTGTWVELTSAATGMDQAEILIFTRMAASKVGATTMDRPEWVACNPFAVEGYCALTNNKNRGVKTNAGGDETPVGGPNPRAKNNYGQIVRWYPADDDHAAASFKWDLFVMAGNPTVHDDAYAGSPNINPGNMFNSPDGMMFDSTGLLWIQTDGNYSNEGDFAGQGNNQMLAGDPATGQIERFLTGPFGCEITGITWSADRRTMFVGVQHPAAPFPDGEGRLPRSSLVAIKRADNALVG